MNWRLLTWKDIAGFLLVAVLVGGLIDAIGGGYLRSANHGFGPEWSCATQPVSEPVCIKKTR